MNFVNLSIALKIPLKKISGCGLIISLVLTGLRMPAQALGSGAMSNVTGTSAKALGHASVFAGVADDPSAVYFNPAGLVQVKGLQTMLDATYINIDASHTADKTTDAVAAGTKDKLHSNIPLIPAFYASYSKDESPLAFGLGVNAPYGLITEWKDDSFSKYYATKSKLLMYMVNPSVAYAVNKRFSVAAGLDYVNLYDGELNARVSPLAGGSGDGYSKLSGSGSAWGYNLGLLYKLTEKHSFGLSYRSQVNVVMKGNAELTDMSGAITAPPAFGGFGASSYKTGVSTEFKLPQTVLVGYGFKPNDKWTLMADYEWANWNKTVSTDFHYDDPNSPLPKSIARNWRNTNNVGVGSEWKARNWLSLRCGALVYERVVPSGNLEASMPDSSRWALSLGSGFHFGNTTIDVAYMGVFYNTRTVDNNHEAINPATASTLYSQDGKFQTTAHAFSVGVTQKWGREK